MNSNNPAPPPVRIQKLLSGWGIASRRTIEEYIQAGRISVDGKILHEQGAKVDPERSVILLDGKRLLPPVVTGPTILALHKPAGVVSTLEDPFRRPTLVEYLPQDRRVYPIGRLDFDSTGLILLTDHGELANRLLHPKYKVEKEYEITMLGQPLSEIEMKRFAEGIPLEDGLTAPCTIRKQNAFQYSVILREGRKRQIKRMFLFFERSVSNLHRVRFGPIQIGSLRPGECRSLTTEERTQLMKAAGLDSSPDSSNLGQK